VQTQAVRLVGSNPERLDVRGWNRLGFLSMQETANSELKRTRQES